jgi:hypothetical protein
MTMYVGSSFSLGMIPYSFMKEMLLSPLWHPITRGGGNIVTSGRDHHFSFGRSRTYLRYFPLIMPQLVVKELWYNEEIS